MATSGGSDDCESSQSNVKKKKCELCGDNIRSGGVKCNKCSCCLHSKCFEQIAKVIKAERVNWSCKNCTSESFNSASDIMDVKLLQLENESLKREISLLKKIVSDQDYINFLQKEKLNELSPISISTNMSTISKPTATISYSDAVKNIINKDKQESTVLLVKSQNKNNVEIQKQIKTKITSSDLCGINVNGTKAIRNGVLINCDNSDSMLKLKLKLSKELDNSYNIHEPKKLNPRIIVYGVDMNFELNSEFICDMTERNDIDCSLDDFKFITALKRTRTSNANVNVVLEVSPRVRRQIINKGYLYIGWSRCGVADYCIVPRCFKCSRYSHQKSTCRNETTCPQCAGPHELQDCQSEVFNCINCVEYNKLHKANLPTNHAVRDVSCSVHKLKLEFLIAKINYDG